MNKSVVLLGFVSILSVSASIAEAQSVQLQDETATLIERVGSAQILFGEGPRMMARANRQSQSRYQWYIVQDSTLGVVFRKPSGVKVGTNGCFDGDVDISRINKVGMGVEVRAVTFNYWNELTGVFRVSELRSSGLSDDFDMNPDWSESGDTEAEHRTSVMWIHRTWNSETDEITSADLTPVLAAVQALGHESVTLEDLTQVTNATSSPGTVGDLFLGYRWGERGGCKG